MLIFISTHVLFFCFSLLLLSAKKKKKQYQVHSRYFFFFFLQMYDDPTPSFLLELANGVYGDARKKKSSSTYV